MTNVELDLQTRLTRAEARVRELEAEAAKHKSQITVLVMVSERARDALAGLWAGIGDALLSGQGISREYANNVAARVREAEDAVEVAVEPFVRDRRRALREKVLSGGPHW